MDDSFSRLAKELRQKKINKNEIKKIKREIIDGKVLNYIKNNMAIKIQKYIRGYLYRKKYKNFLEQENTEIIINYLYEKKTTRIKNNYKNIISIHILNYIKFIRNEKEKIANKKIKSIDLIKAVMKGILFRKKLKNKISPINEKKNKIEKYIISYKIKLILRSNNIQSLLIDIANIKYSLNNIEKSNDASKTSKIKELTTKLNKNINLFYFTFYQMKENSNWISQTKISEPWLKKYLNILNNKTKNIFVKKKTIYSNQKKIKRLKENNKNTENNNQNNKRDLLKSGEYYTNSRNNTINNDKDISTFDKEKLNNNHKENKDSINYNKKYLLSEGREKDEKSYNFNFYDSESDENNSDFNKNIKKFTQDNDFNIIKKHSIKTEYELKTQKSNEKKNRNNIIKRYKQKKSEGENKLSSNKSRSSEEKEKSKEKEENNIKTNEFKNDDNKEDNISIEKSNRSNNSNSGNKNKSLNKYQQREERPIKPLTNINFLENDNPFGIKKEISNNLTETNKNVISKQKSLEKRVITSNRSINRGLITHNQKRKEKKNNISEIEKDETVKTQEKTDLSHDEPIISNKYLDYDNRPVGGNNINKMNIRSERVSKKIDRNEVPLGGTKNIDYNAMFGEGCEFEGDPFGGSKQFENKDKINKEKNKKIHNKVNNNIKKKPVYDARKAIEEAKLKEAKEGKKEKPSAFREFLREMKKISAEEKALHNETTNKYNKLENKKIEKEINTKEKEKDKEKNVNLNLEKKDAFSDNNFINIEDNNKKKLNKNLKLELKEDNRVKSSKNIMEFEHNKDFKDNTNQQKKNNKGNETKEITLRKKLHELEKAPAPVLNIKGIKSRIECWGNNTKSNNFIQREMPKSKDEKKIKNNNKSNNQRIMTNIIGNKKLAVQDNKNESVTNKTTNSSNNIPKINKNEEDKIEKYVDKKLMILSLQIEEIDDLFNLETYYKQKENKMKKYINIPYIQKDYDYIVKYTNDSYDEKIEQIQLVYKELK